MDDLVIPIAAFAVFSACFGVFLLHPFFEWHWRAKPKEFCSCLEGDDCEFEE